MKRIIYKLALILIAGTLIALPVKAQETSVKKTSEKSQKEINETKKAGEERQKEIQLKEAEKEKFYMQKEIQRNEEAAKRAEEYARQAEKRMQERMERHREVRVRDDSTGRLNVYVFSDSIGNFSFEMPEMPEMPEMDEMPYILDFPELNQFSVYGNRNYSTSQIYYGNKAGSTWNYSRRLLEATFSNEYSIGGDESAEEVSLSISGDCAEGAILIAIYTPDGNKLSEVSIDENGSMNWRKSFKAEDMSLQKGNWVFKISAKNATGQFNISMNAF